MGDKDNNLRIIDSRMQKDEHAARAAVVKGGPQVRA